MVRGQSGESSGAMPKAQPHARPSEASASVIHKPSGGNEIRACFLSSMGHQCTVRRAQEELPAWLCSGEELLQATLASPCHIPEHRGPRTPSLAQGIRAGIQARRFLLSLFSFCILGLKVQLELPSLFSAEELCWNWGG